MSATSLTAAPEDPPGTRRFTRWSVDARWSRQAIYTVTVFIFWGVVSTAGAMTLWLAIEEQA